MITFEIVHYLKGQINIWPRYFYSFEIQTVIVMTKTKIIERLCFHYFKIPRTCWQNNNPFILPQGITDTS